MRRITPIAGAVVALAGWSLAAQVASTPGASGPPPSLKSIGLIVYPAGKQSPQQQAADESECVAWAESQTGVKLSAGKVDTEAAARAAQSQAAEATTGAAVGGAARGALVGTAMGAVTGNAGEGAAIGAIGGAVAGRRAKKQAEAQAAQQGAAQAQGQNDALVNQFKKAAGTCLAGRGYSVS